MSSQPATANIHPRRAAKYAQPWQPRPARSLEDRLKKLHISLVDQINDGHISNAIKTCKKVLSLDNSSSSAFKTLIFLLLQNDDYAAALKAIAEPPSAHGTSETYQFERAYCLYRLHREQEALKAIGELKEKQGSDFKSDEGRKVANLEAQILYRAGRYAEARKLFQELLASCEAGSSEHDDLAANLQATETRIDFESRAFRGGLQGHDLDQVEQDPPVIPAPTSSSRVSRPITSSSRPVAKRTKPRHALPKGATLGKPFTEDPDRWLPLKQRASYNPNAASSKSSRNSKLKRGGANSKRGGGASKKKQGNVGVGATQGSTIEMTPAAAAATSSPAGGKSAKGKGKRR